MNVPDIRADVLSQIAALRPSGEVLAVIPAYIGPWAVAAADAARFLEENPEERALFVYNHDTVRDRFAAHIAHTLGDAMMRVTIANWQTVAAGGFSDTAYVAAPESSWERIWGAIDPQFTLRHSERRTALEGTDARHTVVAPTYVEAGGRNLQWTPDDSIGYYQALYFGEGGAVAGRKIVDLANDGEGPHKIRLYRGFDAMGGLRDAAGLGDDVIYHRGLSLEDRIAILRQIGDDRGRTPSVTEIQAALSDRGGPDYTTLLGGVGLEELRRLADQSQSGGYEAARKAAMADWTAADSAQLYRELSEAAGKPGRLTRRELEKALPKLSRTRRPTIHEMLAPFATTDQDDGKHPFDRMRDAAAQE